MNEELLEIGPNGISLDLLKAIYRNSAIPLPVRMRAAIAAIPFEVPKLAVTYQATEQDFATLLDRRLQRIAEMKLIEAQPTKATDGGTNNGGTEVDARLPPPIPDRRFRRI